MGLLYLFHRINGKNHGGDASAKAAPLLEFSYSPGYCDMCGELHHSELRKNEDGEWQIETRDRSEFGEPMLTTIYAVSAEAVERFETFLREKKVLSLEKRRDSKEFVTDYSPWHYIITYGKMIEGRMRKDFHSIRQYKRYSPKDYALLKELNQRFDELYGEKISETSGMEE